MSISGMCLHCLFGMHSSGLHCELRVSATFIPNRINRNLTPRGVVHACLAATQVCGGSTHTAQQGLRSSCRSRCIMSNSPAST